MQWEAVFMGKRKWITKKEISTILKTYSVRTDEFNPFGDDGYCFVSKYTHGYMLSINNELQYGTEKTGRITVTHTNGNGYITFNDVWERDTNGNLQFCFRNPHNIPLSDAAYIKDLEQQISELKSAGQKLEAQSRGYQPGQPQYPDQAELLIQINTLMDENQKLQEQVNSLTEENQKLINNTKPNARGAGRKADPAHLESQAKKVQDLLDSGKTSTEVQKIMGISRSTFFRYKRFIKGC